MRRFDMLLVQDGKRGVGCAAFVEIHQIKLEFRVLLVNRVHNPRHHDRIQGGQAMLEDIFKGRELLVEFLELAGTEVAVRRGAFCPGFIPIDVITVNAVNDPVFPRTAVEFRAGDVGMT